MLRQVLASTKYVMLVVILSIYAGAVALIFYETAVVGSVIVSTAMEASVSPEGGRILAVGLLGAIDVFLIAIVGYIICAGLFVLFVDNTLPLPSWLVIHSLEDLKNNLVSVIVAVLAVLFAKEVVARTGQIDLLGLGVAIALMIGALTLFLVVNAWVHRSSRSEVDGSKNVTDSENK